MILLFHQGVYVITRSIHVFDGISYIYLININQNVGKYTIHIHIHGWHEVKKQKSLYDVNSRKPFWKTNQKIPGGKMRFCIRTPFWGPTQLYLAVICMESNLHVIPPWNEEFEWKPLKIKEIVKNWHFPILGFGLFCPGRLRRYPSLPKFLWIHTYCWGAVWSYKVFGRLGLVSRRGTTWPLNTDHSVVFVHPSK